MIVSKKKPRPPLCYQVIVRRGLPATPPTIIQDRDGKKWIRGKIGPFRIPACKP